MADNDLKVALLSLDIANDDPELNLSRVDRALCELQGEIRLAVLPEMCLTGYNVTDTTRREDLRRNVLTSERMERLQTMAHRYNMYLWGTASAAEEGSDMFRNRGFMIAPDESTEIYDKHHIFTPGGEGRFYRGGELMAPIVDVDGWLLKMCICYDLRFPAWNRNGVEGTPYDALVVPANWPKSRKLPWHQLLIARAIENQCYVLGCDRTGSDLYGEYLPEMTAVYDFWGTDISLRGETAGVPTVKAELSKSRLNRAREKFPVLKDADTFVITGRV